MLFSLIAILACTDNLLVAKSEAEKEGDNPGECSDLIDNDEDGFIDCDDQDCHSNEECDSTDTDVDTAVEEPSTEPSNEPSEPAGEPSEETGEEEDLDGDGYTEEEGDCNDSDPAIYPNAEDSLVDGVDQDCNGVDGPDADGDGFVASEAGGNDCDDTNPNVHPNASEIPDDGLDNDCFGGDQVTPQNEFDVGGAYYFDVPTGVTEIQVDLWGGGGGGGDQFNALGGGGGYVSATLSVTPAETLTVYVGQGGQSSGQGAGGTFILRGSAVLAVAGGGGGGGSDGNSGNSYTGGAGGAGGQVAENGQDMLTGPGNGYCNVATGGTGATQTTGGQGGVAAGGASSICSGVDGAQYQGGGSTGSSSQCIKTGPNYWTASGGGGNGHSGAGGSGYYGGGGGGGIYTYCGAGGGGGSSWVISSAVSAQYLDGSGQTEGNAANSQGAGHGGEREYNGLSPTGADGRVEIVW